MKKIFFDIGANRGQSINLFKRKWEDWREYTIISMEADRRVIHHFQHYKDEVPSIQKDHPAYDFRFYYGAAWVRDGVVEFYESQDNDHGSSVMRNKLSGGMSRFGSMVPCYDLAALIKNECAPDDYVILKIDVEGAEYDILPHLIQENAMSLVDVLFIEFHTWKVGKTQADDENILKQLSAYPRLDVQLSGKNGLDFI